MRRELKKRGVKKLLCAWSDEPPHESNVMGDHGKPAPASISFVPSAMGLVMAGEIIRKLSGI
jgi:tRNA A37 threonylcarbamoyladenosine dehydratase